MRNEVCRRILSFLAVLASCSYSDAFADDYQQIALRCPQAYENCGAGIVGDDPATHCTWGQIVICEIPGPFGCLLHGKVTRAAGNLDTCFGAPPHESFFFPPDAPPLPGFSVTSSHLVCPGDVSGVVSVADGEVTFDDLLAVLEGWGSAVKEPSPVDLNSDSAVDNADLEVVIDNFGTQCR
ncbi:MAG: hypothetical protein KDD64_06140 [Bdellovibrionales bacterium]|nr:hypothetical protein [Bdellovibrionales bacterium]